MNLKIFLSINLLIISTIAFCQTETQINQTDASGRKQGKWIKRYPDESILYEGIFKDDHPAGEFRRYYEDNTLRSLLYFNNNGTEADAVIYHPNGNIASRGKYINQKKEGKWQFFSAMAKDYLICEEIYSGNLRHGLSVKYFPDSTVAERVRFVNDVRHGEWTRYYPDGSILLKSYYVNGKIDGKFEVWFGNGKIEFSGQYKNDARDGLWFIYNNDGSIKYQIEYKDGNTDNRQMEIDESDYLDSLENNNVGIPDPEKTGVLQ